jgi:hypothetical protein
MERLIGFGIGVRLTAFLHGIMVAESLGIDVITHRLLYQRIDA